VAGSSGRFALLRLRRVAPRHSRSIRRASATPQERRRLVSRSKISIAGSIGLILLIGLACLPGRTVQAATGNTCPAGLTVTQITAPFNYGGAGEFCWSSTELGQYIQSWGTDVVQVTGVDYTNQYVVTDQMLRDTTGTYYVYYKASTANGNFSAVGSSGITGCHAEWCSIGQYSSMAFPPYTMYNNVWGATSGQMISVESPSNWWVNANFPETSGVKSYPNASLDLTGKTLSNLGSCTSSFNVTGPSSGSWEFAYDLWVPSEVMIWMHKNGNVGPIAQGWNSDGTPIPSATNVSVGGSTWAVYHGGSNVVSFVRQGNIDSGTVDVTAILSWIAAQGWISTTSGLGKFQFGPEISSAPGGLTFTINSYSMSCGGVVGPTPTIRPSATPTVRPSATPTVRPSATPTVRPSATPTVRPSATPTIGPSATPTIGPSATPTGGATCSPVNATITAPYSYDGAGAFCWQSSNLGSYINSWNLASLKINGVDFTNKYAFTSSLPAKINGYWYVSYSGGYAWSHFEAK
jgi:xyloglucan-specific endo-beta-1,4-glucanase